MQIVAGKYRIGREQKNNLYKIIGSNRIKRIANIRMERSGFNSDPVFSDQDEHSDNVSVRSSSKLLPPPSWNESSVYSKELPAGATLEHYKILKVLGSGGFGITFIKKASATGISNREISCLRRKGLPSSLISARRAV